MMVTRVSRSRIQSGVERSSQDSGSEMPKLVYTGEEDGDQMLRQAGEGRGKVSYSRPCDVHRRLYDVGDLA